MHRYLTTAEVAAHYRTVSSTVRYWRHIGYGPKCAKVGRQYLYPETALRDFDAQLLAPSVHTGTVPEVQSGALAAGNDEATRGPAGSPQSSESTSTAK
ncbi:helix-turn-helix domain-containing protein [Streptomyces phaeochromogenes]|uniref:helix-turn-helix domain-containing protein n=1 Tax=Streptomyces phaeochromogenes TaxID=1923 RepID=UPI00398CA5A9